MSTFPITKHVFVPVIFFRVINDSISKKIFWIFLLLIISIARLSQACVFFIKSFKSAA